MGQQQLLILLLVTVIVAVATIIAMDTMLESRESANLDALQQDMVFIINEAQGYYFRNSHMQGGGRSFDNIDMSDVSIDDSTENGTYSLSGSGNTLTVQGDGVYEDVSLKATAQFADGDLEISWERSK
ncbi:MAG: hypothetical protein R3281_07755 [Balneolaceae bacterium]|nr:hypothetical protein [Balneolaceae bacterium]